MAYMDKLIFIPAYLEMSLKFTEHHLGCNRDNPRIARSRSTIITTCKIRVNSPNINHNDYSEIYKRRQTNIYFLYIRRNNMVR